MLLEDIRARMVRDGYWEGEIVKYRKDGSQVAVASRWSPQLDASGRQIGTLETCNDITQRKRAEEALLRSHAAYLAEAQTLSLTGSFGWNTSTGEVFWSDQSFSIFGYDAGATPSLDLMLQRVLPDDISAVQRAFARASDEDIDFDIEFRLSMPAGAIKHIHAVAHPMANGNGKRQFVGAVMDVTAAKNAEERLHMAQAELAYIGRMISLGALSSSIAHEINQPLAAIVANSEACLRWLGRGAQGLNGVSTILKTIMSDSKRASEIVQRIRGFSKRAELKKSEVSLNDVIQEVLPLIQREIASHRALLQLDLGRDLSLVLGDRVQLQQVIINLILNAVQAMAAPLAAPCDLWSCLPLFRMRWITKNEA
jgi:PAS domain S-box-containing protein